MESERYYIFIILSPLLLEIMTKPLKDRFSLLKQYFRQDEVRSLFIVLTSVFVSALGSTIIITGVWPYLEVVRSDNSNLLPICIHLLIQENIDH